MPDYTIYVLDESDATISGAVLDGVTQGDGSHLVGATITVNAPNWTAINISDAGGDVSFGDNDGNQTLNGAQEIDGVTYADGTQVEAEYEITLQDANGNTYTALGFNVNNSSPSFGTVEGLAFVGVMPPVGVPLTVTSSGEGPNYLASDYAVPCFTKGTRIMTPGGQRKIEDLVVGDIVSTANGDEAHIRWIGQVEVDAAEMAQSPKLRPIRISAGSMGAGLPSRDLLVSRQHRMLVSSSIAQRMFGARDVLVPAIRLTEIPGIYVDMSVEQTCYIHLLLDTHDVILAENTPSESLYLGEGALNALPSGSVEEISTLFPELIGRDVKVPPACLIPQRKRQRRLVERHVRNGKPLLGCATLQHQ